MPTEVLGEQRPRIACYPNESKYDLSTLGIPAADANDLGHRAVKLAAIAGLHLLDWQQFMLIRSLERRADGLWCADEVGLVVGRQNGKNGILEARQLAGLFLIGERLQVHTAHLGTTAKEAFLRLSTRIKNTKQLAKRLPQTHNRGISNTNGAFGITLANGCRILFGTRSKGSFRGASIDTLYLDEAMELVEDDYNGMLPTLSAVTNPQHWLTASAPDQTTHKNALVLARQRLRAIAGKSLRLLYGEWGVTRAELVADPTLRDKPETWAVANPSLGALIRQETIAGEHDRAAGNYRGFDVERLGAGDWPDPDGGGVQAIPLEDVEACTDPESVRGDDLVIALHVSRDRQHAAFGVASNRPDGHTHLELIDHRPDQGTGWVVARAVALMGKWKPSCGLVVDLRGPAGSIGPDLVDAGVELVNLTAQEHADFTGAFIDGFALPKIADDEDDEVAELAEPAEPPRRRIKLRTPVKAFTDALKVAALRPLGNAKAWDDRADGVDITPVEALTFADGALRTKVQARPYLDDHPMVVIPD